MEEQTRLTDRRIFLKNAASIAAVGALGSSLILKSCSSDKTQVVAPTFLDQAPDGKVLKVGLIGCGGRGTGAIFNFLNSGPGIEIVSLGDAFQNRVDRCRSQLKEQKNVEIADEKCFVGLDAYEKVIDSGVDVVVLATPPYFRPQHFDAAVRARKHVFMEKPLAVDPVGARSIMASGKMAEAAGLKVGCGTQRHHQRDYLTVYEHIKAGAIGDIVGANCYWNQGQLWFVNPEPGVSELDAMIKDWVNWTWLSGDHIVEQHVHNIDVINWFTGKIPTKAVGFGSRQRRPTGDQYDNFSVDYVYDDGMHMHSMCRQINGCTNNVSEFIIGTKGKSNCNNRIEDLQGNPIFEFAYAEEGYNVEGKPAGVVNVSPYDQEIIDLVAAIRNNTPFNEVELCATSTMVGIMGRISAYTGKEVTYEEMMNSNLKLGPEDINAGAISMKAVVAVPGVV